MTKKNLDLVRDLSFDGSHDLSHPTLTLDHCVRNRILALGLHDLIYQQH